MASERLYFAKEFIEKPDYRRNMPVLIINLDGVFGYWDHNREIYVIRSKTVDAIMTLSYDFSLVAVSS